MDTNKLIDILSTNLEPVAPGVIHKAMTGALVLGAAGAFGVMLVTVAPRPNVWGDDGRAFLALKLAFTISLGAAGAAWLLRSVHPGRDVRQPFWLVSLPFLAIAVAGAVDLLRESSASWSSAMFGTQWAICVVCIPLFAVIPFVLLVWAARRGAPTHLRRTGAMAGLVAGALGAVAYTFHCPDDYLPFIALWYGGGIAFCAAAGGLLGPRLLRW
jgi:hypothetical protein